MKRRGGSGRARKKRFSIRKRTSPGDLPGTLVPDPEAPHPRVTAICYGPGKYEEHVGISPDALRGLLGKHPVTWVDIDGLGDARVISAIGDVLGLHPLELEDAINLYQRPKVEEYPNNLFIVMRTGYVAERVRTEQLAMCVGESFVVTFQGEVPGDSLDPVRKRLKQAQGRLCSSGPDYLAYALIDAVVDHYFPITDQFGESLEKLEDELIVAPIADARERIQVAKQDIAELRRTILPMREVINTLARDDLPFVKSETRVFLRDCFDHAVQLMDVVNSQREIAGGLMELYLLGVSLRMNEIMKFLTLVSTIFIPLTFVVGVYGMNFDPTRSRWNMPELEHPYGYPMVMGAMVVMAVGLVGYFRHKGWLGPTR